MEEKEEINIEIYWNYQEKNSRLTPQGGEE